MVSSLLSTFRYPTLLLALLSAATATAQTETPATVPDSFVGTYTLSYDLINNGGPFTAGQEVTLVLHADNTLCIAGQLLSNPVFRNGNQVEAIWKDEASGYEIAVSNFTGSFNEVNVTGSNFSPFYGQLSGSKTSDSTTCGANGGGGSNPQVTTNMNAIFAAAESKLAAIFPPGQQTQFQDQYVYRYYPNTGVYLAFADNNVYLLGGSSVVRSSVSDPSSSFSMNWNPCLIRVPVVVAAQSYGFDHIRNLRYQFCSGLSFSGITLTDIPAPDLSNTQEINEEIFTTLKVWLVASAPSALRWLKIQPTGVPLM